MINVDSTGSTDNLERFLKRMQKPSFRTILERYGREGTDALSENTPIHSGLTADSWRFEIIEKDGIYSLAWHNTNVVTGIPVVILIQYGHGTKNGGWVEGYDFINPVVQPLFTTIADDLWSEVRNA